MKKSICTVPGLVGVLLLVRLGSPPYAQAAVGPNQLQEVIVTAEKTKENMQDVGTSITALTAADVRKLGLTDVTAVASQTPGLQFNQFSPTLTVFNIRGVSQNDFADQIEPPIAVYNDGVYVASMGAVAGSMFDLARVEVLRGPQGTLFGRNATGGLIDYISEKPQFDTEGSLSLTGGDYSTARSEGFFNTALNDQLAVRFSFATDYHDGYVENRIGPSLGNQNQYAARLQLLYKPSDAATVLLKFYGVDNSHETGAAYSWEAAHPDGTGRAAPIGPTSTANCPNLDGGCTPGGDITGYVNASASPFNQAYGTPGFFDRTIGGSTLNVTWNFDSVTLTSVTDYMHMWKHYEENSGMTPTPYFLYDDAQNYHQLSQELHLNGQTGALRWITGLYFLDLSTRIESTAITIPAFGGTSGANYSQSTHSEAAFGQAWYNFTSALTGIAGIRYSNDQDEFNYFYPDYGTPIIYNPSTNPAARQTFSNITGKLELDYKLDRNLLLYVSWNRGAKGGGWSAPFVGAVTDTAAFPFREEFLTSYETGEKLTFLGGRARLNSDVFYYDYRNYQGFFVKDFNNFVENVGARVKGAEIELALVPVIGASLQLGVSNLNSVALRVPLPAGELANTELPQAPKWSVNAAASYEWSVPTGRVGVEVDGKWNTSQYMELENAPADYEGPYVVANTRVTYSGMDDRFEIAGWVKNFTNRWYRIYTVDTSAFLGAMQNVYGPPRTYGVTVTYRWLP